MIADLTDKQAIVTGGASGIGRGISTVLARQGAVVTVADLDLKGAEATAEAVRQEGGTAYALEVDVTDPSSVRQMVDQTLERMGRVDILVNNAGVIGAPGWWEREEPSQEDWLHAYRVNVLGVVNVTQAVAPSMKERRYGKIVNIASIAARQGSVDLAHYSASKAAVVNWTQTNALQLAPYNINVNAICPGLLWTPMWERIAYRRSRFGLVEPDLQGLEGREFFLKTVERWIPLGREQTPEDVGKLAAFLASDDAANITGQAINLDGGRRMN